MENYIPVLDLFAGPGGLAEGTSAFIAPDGKKPFDITLSVEKESSAWRTLRLRAFTRQFKDGLPSEYYGYIAGKLGNIPEDELFKIFPIQAEQANKETLQFTLGDDCNLDLDAQIKEKLKKSKNWVLIGGPPCQAYSLVGRARNKGNSEYKAEDDHRHFLYKEYLRIIKNFQPAIFVMENVKGILSSSINGDLIFHHILDDLEQAGYKIYSLVKTRQPDSRPDPHDFIICSEQYGIPQERHRVIVLGVRHDIKREPELLKPKNKVTVEQSIGDLPQLRSRLSKHRKDDTNKKWVSVIHEEIQPVLDSINDQAVITRIQETLKFIETKLNKEKYFLKSGNSSHQKMPTDTLNWYRDDNMHGVINHEARWHMDSDLARYLYCSIYAQVYSQQDMRSSPKLHDFPHTLLPAHKNVKSGKFVDRFKVQEKHLPASTITSHLSKDGHYFIHYDPAQCRSLTVREAARLQTFPDNYFFEGTRTQQYVQVGNAVPPLLAQQIAGIIYKLLA
ncbi:DNA cytosine methyltransferase [Methylobacter svalbardensis]|uniref:DNA cytosine methyltransferase n=1 Tax=Methylobacter svalbardensis TaxID=3080016 RepID=UPI0030EF22E3